MRFTPKNDDELNPILPEGIYGFEISKGEDKVSKIKEDGSGGNEMIELLIRVFKPDGSFILVNDYLMEAILYKVSHAARACGLYEKYESGSLHGEDFVGKTGELKLGIQKASGNFPEKNTVKDYVVPKEGQVSAPPKGSNKAAETKGIDELEDEIPF